MRSNDKPASLAELMGKTSGQLTVKDLPNVLGEKMPELPFNRIGKYRLTNALQQRFGAGYQNIPGIKNLMADFDKHIETHNIIKMNKESQRG